MTLISFMIYALATWRISSLLVEEAGPFRMFVKIRELTGIRHDSDDLPGEIPCNFFAGLLSCVWCASVWIGIMWCLISFLSFGLYLAIPFALSTAAILLNNCLDS